MKWQLLGPLLCFLFKVTKVWVALLWPKSLPSTKQVLGLGKMVLVFVFLFNHIGVSNAQAETIASYTGVDWVSAQPSSIITPIELEYHKTVTPYIAWNPLEPLGELTPFVAGIWVALNGLSVWLGSMILENKNRGSQISTWLLISVIILPLLQYITSVLVYHNLYGTGGFLNINALYLLYSTALMAILVPLGSLIILGLLPPLASTDSSLQTQSLKVTLVHF